MTDPQQDVSLASYGNHQPSSIQQRGSITSPAIPISPALDLSKGRPALNATNQANTKSTNGYDGQTAYTTNPSLDTQASFLSYDLDPSPTVNVHDTSAATTQSYLARKSTDAHAAARPDLEFASFPSQDWAPTTPYVNLTQHPVYEATGELLNEHFDTFTQFDHPSYSNPSVDHVETEVTGGPATSANVTVTANTSVVTPVFVQPFLPRSALKRKAELDTSPGDSSASTKRQQVASSVAGKLVRTVSFERMSGQPPTSPEGSESSDLPSGRRTGPNPGTFRGRVRQSTNNAPRASGSAAPSSQTSRVVNRGNRQASAHPPLILPPEKVFPIQIGSELFRLSGASISSDAPSYFTQFFEEQIRQNEDTGGVRTLYIDRDPITFRDVAKHLQGYHIKPVDGSHFVKLFADAQFYSLPRLIDQLFESEIFIQIGERHFQIPKDIFSEPGNSPNFFSLGFAVFFSTPGEVFPGLDRRGLLRPPSITPPYVPGRSAEVFAELLHLLRGYPLHIRNESHRTELLRDCRYFHLRGLEQKIIAHDISYNLERQRTEICLKLEDVKPSGVSFVKDEGAEQQSNISGWVYYARPFVDDTSYEIIIEIGGETTILNLNDMRADFHGLSKARVSSLLQVIANKMNLPTNAPLGLMMLSGGPSSQSASPGHTPLSEDRIKVRLDDTTDIRLNGESYDISWPSRLGQTLLHGPQASPSDNESDSDPMSEGSDVPMSSATAAAGGAMQSRQARPSTRAPLSVPPIETTRLTQSRPSHKKRKRQSSQSDLGEWIVRSGQWRLRVQPNPQDTIRGGLEIIFQAVKIDAFSNERARNARRGFLT